MSKMTLGRMDEIREMLNSPKPQGFRDICRELLCAVRELTEANHALRGGGCEDYSGFSDWALAETCKKVDRCHSSPLHKAVAERLHKLNKELTLAEDAAADAMERAKVLETMAPVPAIRPLTDEARAELEKMLGRIPAAGWLVLPKA